ncbi:MAG: 50S ribosomal protein L23 [Promethearchaeota archaeon]
MENLYYKILIRPVVTEATFNLIEEENKLTFIVDRKANKNMIREAVEKLFKVKVAKVNTLINVRGQKKAFIKLRDDYSAADVAIDLGIF